MRKNMLDKYEIEEDECHTIFYSGCCKCCALDQQLNEIMLQENLDYKSCTAVCETESAKLDPQLAAETQS